MLTRPSELASPTMWKADSLSCVVRCKRELRGEVLGTSWPAKRPLTTRDITMIGCRVLLPGALAAGAVLVAPSEVRTTGKPLLTTRRRRPNL